MSPFFQGGRMARPSAVTGAYVGADSRLRRESKTDERIGCAVCLGKCVGGARHMRRYESCPWSSAGVALVGAHLIRKEAQGGSTPLAGSGPPCPVRLLV